MDLFTHGRSNQITQESPLANRMRPRTLDEYAGQEHIIGEGRLLRRAIQADQLSSLIFYGPPGTGKTTLAMVIANSTKSHFITINAVLAGVKQIREAIANAKERRDLYNQRTTLFVDEVHRWNKAQQDALLPHVENGTLILVGATTENPYFEVNKALVSRSRIFQLRPLTADNLRQIAHQAIADKDRGYGLLNVQIDDDALDHLLDVANGDARGVLNALELAVETTEEKNGRLHITLSVAEESIQKRAVLYDKEGDVHYDTISAFIKSLRGSDPDAALYWMAKMVYAGEDPRFIFRRMAILAGEDVGMADPNAIQVVMSNWQAFERIGMPEGRFHLALAANYLSTCPKSNSAFAFFDALAAVENEQESDVPNHLKDGNRDKEGFGHGKGYLYPHAFRDHWVAQQYLPDSLQGKLFYQPSNQGYEKGIQEQVARRREEQLEAGIEASSEWQVASGDVFTTSPVNKQRDAWLARTVSQSGGNLGRQRDRLFEMAGVLRHHLVLDVNAGGGLLTWEAVRRAPEGGVWAFTADEKRGAALRQMADQMAELERPFILIGSLSELDYLLELRGEANIKFDHIIGRNLKTGALTIDDWQLTIDNLRGKLGKNGRLSLIQPIPRHTQRLYKLIDWAGHEAGLKSLGEQVAIAEEAIYHDADDPLVNWDERDLGENIQLERQMEQRRLSQAHLQRWFGGETGSYGERLGLTAVNLKKVQEIYGRQLRDKVVEWESVVAYVTV